jgi:glucose/arabinose dehydrogenase
MKKLCIMMLLLWTSQIFAQLPNGYTNQELIQLSFSNPMDVEFHPTSNRMVVAERAGRIWICDLVNGEYVKRGSAVIDIANQVTAVSERGMQSIVVDENYIYSYYTVEEDYLFPELNLGVSDHSATINRVSKWLISWDDNTHSGEVILIGTTPSDGIPQTAGNHNGGGLTISNGYLYASTGDSAGGGFDEQAIDRGIMRAALDISGTYKSQILNCANGKLLRVELSNGAGVTTNPFYDAANPRSPESRMWAMGFRNPFDISSDPTNGVIYVADVGQSSFEEITVIDKGGLNAGWGLREGFRINNSGSTTNPDEGVSFASLFTESTSFVDDNDDTQRRFKHHVPEIDFGHSAETRLARFTNGVLDPIIDSNPMEGNSVTGGCKIIGDGFGEDYNGAYIWTDFIGGWLNIALPSSDPINGNYFDSTVNFAPTSTFSGVVDITQNPVDGSLYIVEIFSSDIHQITYDEGSLSTTDTNKDDFVVYYNSATKEHTFSGLKNNATLELYSLSGQKVLKQEIENNYRVKFDFTAGLYIANITLDNKSIQKKIVIN